AWPSCSSVDPRARRGPRAVQSAALHVGSLPPAATPMTLTPTALADTRYHLHPYTQPRQLEREGPLVITRGEGVHVYGEDGKKYLEAMAGLWCASLGFSEKRLVAAATRQMQTLPYYHAFSGKVPGPV